MQTQLTYLAINKSIKCVNTSAIQPGVLFAALFRCARVLDILRSGQKWFGANGQECMAWSSSSLAYARVVMTAVLAKSSFSFPLKYGNKV